MLLVFLMTALVPPHSHTACRYHISHSWRSCSSHWWTCRGISLATEESKEQIIDFSSLFCFVFSFFGGTLNNFGLVLRMRYASKLRVNNKNQLTVKHLITRKHAVLQTPTHEWKLLALDMVLYSLLCTAFFHLPDSTNKRFPASYEPVAHWRAAGGPPEFCPGGPVAAHRRQAATLPPLCHHFAAT